MTTEKTLEKKTSTKAQVSAKKPPVKKAPAPAKSNAKTTVASDVKAAPMLEAKKPKKEHKKMVVRDSFTMPQNEYAKIAEIKAVCLKAKLHVKKSEVLRAGLMLLSKLNAAQLKLALGGLEKIKTGRPQKA